MTTHVRWLCIAGLAVVLCGGRGHLVQARQVPIAPTVQAVLFYSPTCHFCRQIVEEDLPPVIQPYGDQLHILYVDTNTTAGGALYQAADDAFHYSSGVPVLFVGDVILGGVNIPKQLPEVVDKYLAQGGVAWPPIPGLGAYLAAMLTPVPSAVVLLRTGVATQALPTAAPSALPPNWEPAAPVVRAVMFWREGCPHCHEVLDEVLPPLQQKYGSQLEIELVELKSADDIERFYQTAAAFGIARADAGVPLLVIGERVLQGATQISAELPGLIDQYLAQGGIDYPRLSVLAGVLPAAPTSEGMCQPAAPCVAATPTPTAIAQAAGAQLGAASSVSLPRSSGFGIANAVALGLIVALVYSGFAAARIGHRIPRERRWSWQATATLILALLGLGVASYLAYVESQALPAVCGPVGECNAVQSSRYARLGGVLPVGVLGMAGYVGILAAWSGTRLRSDRLASLAALVLFSMALFGTAFSLYLTYLELFVIKAVCAWCLTSAFVMSLLLLLNVAPALWGLSRWYRRPQSRSEGHRCSQRPDASPD